MSAFVRWTCSATGRIFVLGEAAERVLHQLEVVVEVAGPGVVGQRGRGTPGRGRWRRTARAPSSGAGLDAPRGLAAEQLGWPGRATASATKAQVMRGLDVALRAVVEQRPGRSRPRPRRGRGRRRAPGGRRARRWRRAWRTPRADDLAGPGRRRSRRRRGRGRSWRRRYRAAVHAGPIRADASGPSAPAAPGRGGRAGQTSRPDVPSVRVLRLQRGRRAGLRGGGRPRSARRWPAARSASSTAAATSG